MKDYSKMSLNDLAKEQSKLLDKYQNQDSKIFRTKIYDKLQEVGNEIEKRMGGAFTQKEFADALIAEKKSLLINYL